jgi:glyoxylase-like metal-dependent hydrolase (beta-lactamase superfamily II)
MRLTYGILAIALLGLAACSEPSAPPPVSAGQQFIDDVAAALGGRAAIEATRSLTIEAEGLRLNIGQDMTPEAATMEFAISDYTRTIDLADGRDRTSETRTPLFEYFRGRDPFQVVSGIDGDVAYDVAADGSARRASEDVAAERQSAHFHHPLVLVHAALSGDATISNVRNEQDLSLADVTVKSGRTFTMAVDPATNLPAFIESTDHHFYLRDVARRTGFADYTTVGALNLPTEITRSLDEFHVYRLTATAQETGGQPVDIGAPAEARSAAVVSGPAPANVVAEALADGVWFLAGQSHHSVLIEFDDHLKIIEAPNETRTLAVIEKAQELVPGKSVTHLINTHHHFDHSGGIRTAVAQGLTIVTHAANEAFYRRMAEQPSTIQPDALAESPTPISVETIDDSLVYEDESMRMELYHVAGSGHSDSILMAYLPGSRLLVEADLYTPGRSTPQAFAPNMVENIERLGLEVERVAPIHGGVVEYSVVEEAVAALAE